MAELPKYIMLRKVNETKTGVEYQVVEELPTQSNAPNTLDAFTNTCPLCGGTLSEIRTDGKRKWRHCYSCHMEQEETT